MTKLLLTAVGMLTVITLGTAESRAAKADVTATSRVDAQRVLDQYCVSCHSARLKTAGLILEGLNLGNPGAAAAQLEKVVRKLRAGTMPPVGAPRPDAVMAATLRDWIEQQ